jgi:hypothetical protein
MEEAKSFYWVRTITDDTVVYKPRFGNQILGALIIVPLLLIPFVGWAVVVWLIWYSLRGSVHQREIRKLAKEGHITVSGARFSAKNPVTVKVDRPTFDRIIGQPRS